MKKIFYFIASAIVALGAVACQNDINEGVTPEQEGFSINANIGDITRIAITDSENKEGYKTLSWEGTETLTAYLKGERFEFTNTTEAPNTFTCTTPGVKAKFEEEYATSNSVEFYYNYNLLISGEYDKHEVKYALVGQYKGGEEAINMTVAGCIFHFSCTEEVTLKYSYPLEDGNYGAFLGGMQELTFSAGEYYIGATVRSEETTLEAWIGDEKVKSTTQSFEENKIYNLGTIEKPAPKTYKVYVIAQPKSAQAAWTKVNVYTWDIDPLTAWPGTDITNNTEIINGYTYNYLEYPATWTGKSVNVIINNGSAQTADIVLGTLDKNYYIVYNTDGTVYTEAPAAGSIKEVEATLSEWALAGDFNSWGDKVMEVVAGANNLFVAKNLNISAYTEIKVKKVGDWNTSYGGGITYLNANKWMKLSSGGSNIAIVTAGTYDVYFDKANTKLYLMKSGVDYNTAAEQSANGPAPDTSKYTWGIVGNHNGWGNDNVLTWDGTLGLYVAKGVKLNGEFKVRADKAWTTSFGNGGTVTVNNAKATTVYNNGGNCKLSSYSGTYDIYFWYDTTNIKANGKIWVYTAGNAAPTL